MRNDIILEDTTLRDGEQASGLGFDKEAKIEIYKALVDAGVKWLEVGFPAMGGTELETIKIIKEMAHSDGVVALAYSKGILEDVAFSLSLGFKAIHFGVPTAFKDAKYTPNWMMTQAQELIKFAKDKDAFVSISAVDIGRADLSFLQDYACIVQEAGADRLRLSDTTGILMPEQYRIIVEAVKNVSTIALQCHAHNDFGFALANTIAALNAGVKYFHVTVNGIGERAGMPDFAQLVLALKRFYQVDLGINMEKLTELSRIVSKHTRVPLYPWHPIVGSKVFTYEDEMFEPFPPELVGGERKIVLGKHSSKKTIKHKLELLGIEDVNDEKLALCLSEIQERSMKQDPDILDLDNELLNIYNNLKLVDYCLTN